MDDYCVDEHFVAHFQTLVLPDIPDDLSLDQVIIPDEEVDTSEKIQRLHALLTNYLKRP